MLLNPYRFGSAPATDPYFSSVTLLLHAEALVDSSSHNYAVSAENSAVLSTAQAQAGTHSLACVSSTSKSFFVTGGVLSMAAGDYTVEGWFYATAYPAVNASLVGDFQTGTSSFEVFIDSSGFLVARASVTGSGDGSIFFVGPSGSSLNAWHHFAVVRSGTTVKVYLDGVAGTPVTDSRSYHIGTVVNIGRNGDGVWFLDGYLDEIRVTIGVARYTANFTPPTTPFPDS